MHAWCSRSGGGVGVCRLVDGGVGFDEVECEVIGIDLVIGMMDELGPGGCGWCEYCFALNPCKQQILGYLGNLF